MTTAVSQLYVRRPDPDVAMRWTNRFHGATLWSKQEEVSRLVFGGRFRTTLVKACNGAGKTVNAAHIGVAWLCTGVDRTVVTTAPTGRQVRDLLWKEIRSVATAVRQNGGGELRMPPRAPELRMHPDHPQWYAVGFSSNDPSNFLGTHSRGGVLFIGDEGPGIREAIWNVVPSIQVGEHDRALWIGNPFERRGPYYDAFQRNDVNKVTISAWDTPNIIAGRVVIDGLISQAGIDAMIAEFGVGSPLLRPRLDAEFPDDATNTLVPDSWLELAFQRADELDANTAKAPRDRLPDDPVWREDPETLGLDIAGGGADDTVATRCHEQGVRAFIYPAVKITGPDTTGPTVGFAINVLNEHPRITAIQGDDDGIGHGTMGTLHTHYSGDRKRRVSVVAMHGGRTDQCDTARYLNNRCAWLWAFRLACDPNGKAPIAVRRNTKLLRQATSIMWKLNRKGQVCVETKDEMRARGIKSPDELDACAYGLAASVKPAELPTFIPLATRTSYWRDHGDSSP